MRNPAPRGNPPATPHDTDDRDDAVEPALTTAADVESAGRSCMAILVLLALILLIVVIWLVYRSAS
jgi:cobalamin biosynthesis Mg chelatase CobN